MRQSYWLVEARFTVIRSPADTRGRYDVVEGWFPAGAQLPPHIHRLYSEQIHVLEGELTVWAGDCKTVLHPGENIVIPTGTAHAVHVTGGGPARGLVLAAPSGFARLVAEVGARDEGNGAPTSAATDMDLLRRVSAELGDEILGPPGALPDWSKRGAPHPRSAGGSGW